jgi:RNA polymerase sigma-70 factor, ECF subfamily
MLEGSVTVAQVENADDARLVERLRAGDESAFAELVRTHHSSLLRVARLFVPTAALAEDVVGETWLGVVKGIDRFEGRSSLKTWIFRILTNIAKTRGQRESRSLPFSSLDDADGTFEPAVESGRFTPVGHWADPPHAWPEERVISRETLEVIEDAIESLPPAQRAVISLRDVEGWDAEEVRNALELSETNQRVLLHRARAKVRRALDGYLMEQS